MQITKFFSIFLVLLSATNSCSSPKSKIPEPPSQGPRIETPTPAPNPAVASPSKAYHISGNIDEAVQEGDVCDASVPFTVPGTLKFEFTPSSASKGKYTYSGPFNANGSGPYEIYEDGKMLVEGTGCIMGRCATYSHHWTAKSIDPKTCGNKEK